MMEHKSVMTLAKLNVTLAMAEKSATTEEDRVMLKVCERMIDDIAASEGVDDEYEANVIRLLELTLQGVERMMGMSESNRKILIEHSWDDVKRSVE